MRCGCVGLASFAGSLPGAASAGTLSSGCCAAMSRSGVTTSSAGAASTSSGAASTTSSNASALRVLVRPVSQECSPHRQGAQHQAPGREHSPLQLCSAPAIRSAPATFRQARRFFVGAGRSKVGKPGRGRSGDFASGLLRLGVGCPDMGASGSSMLGVEARRHLLGLGAWRFRLLQTTDLHRPAWPVSRRTAGGSPGTVLRTARSGSLFLPGYRPLRATSRGGRRLGIGLIAAGSSALAVSTASACVDFELLRPRFAAASRLSSMRRCFGVRA